MKNFVFWIEISWDHIPEKEQLATKISEKELSGVEVILFVYKKSYNLASVAGVKRQIVFPLLFFLFFIGRPLCLESRKTQTTLVLDFFFSFFIELFLFI